ncbi:MAG: HAMP domain-containing sensor histidine kinase [Steroidobacteraceae bacterium]|nr:HAMP domain-containing histidine kinase [Nevskiaceae bacterium]MCP5339787.1 HAMP domain-containing histidine kinase [Nevskiaceae bacterium]MCP5360345.1 HAMP domain-containing histidine kinase [Nevskiaceae bacterium]MCP5467271.1 HAMP domain-containing histidine kinase [Nevskiaceae bacterium]MCP5471154.1 HAMP domain-containing histidine kinase [Nevskiaceae bacterium]
MKILLFDRRALGMVTLSVIAALAAFITAFTWLDNRVTKLLDEELLGALQRELQVFQALQRETSTAWTVAALQRRARYSSDVRRTLLLDDQGRVVFGRLEDWPEGITLRRNLAQGPSSRHDQQLYLVSGPVGKDHTLFLGEIDQRHGQVGRSLVAAGVVAMLVVLATGLLIGLRFNHYVLARLASIAQTAREIMRGQMKARAPDGQRLDALGSLARVFNEMLDQNEALVTGMRTATESLAHDLRTPLTRLQSAIAAARDTTDPQRRDELLAGAQAESEHILRTFSALIDLARAEAGLSRDAMERTDLAALATDIADLFEPLAEERQQHLERDIQPTVALAHRQILFQAVGNLLENAIKYSPTGSVVRLALEPGTARHGPTFVVTDAGPGIPAYAREQALRPFVRLEPAGRKPGSGLGLAIASTAARLHGGGLQLEDADPGLRVRLQFGAHWQDGDAEPAAIAAPLALRAARPSASAGTAMAAGARSAAEA